VLVGVLTTAASTGIDFSNLKGVLQSTGLVFTASQIAYRIYFRTQFKLQEQVNEKNDEREIPRETE
jgi:hypothetical protein